MASRSGWLYRELRPARNFGFALRSNVALAALNLLAPCEGRVDEIGALLTNALDLPPRDV